ncbi:hypothetical protein HDV62DRAFT_401124 [Trichoderma sp. SZMC 28011]
MANPTRQRGGLSAQVMSDSGITYIYGYRSVFIRPMDVTQRAYVHAAAAARSCAVEVDIDLTAAASAKVPGRPFTINVYAEELCFVTGTSYSLPGVSLSLHCRRLVILPSLDAASASTPISFNLNGLDGTEAASTKTTPPAARGANAPGIYSWAEESNCVGKLYEKITGDTVVQQIRYNEAAGPPTYPEAGVAGENGSPGARGNDAGSFQIYVEELENSTTTTKGVTNKVFFAISLNGGKGARGQDGQDGGNGGPGIDWTVAEASILISEEFKDPAILLGFIGGLGGPAGHGGPGGRGGAAGTVSIFGPESLAQNLQAIFVVENRNGSSGANGNPGRPGKQGPYSRSRLYKPKYQRGMRWGFKEAVIPDKIPTPYRTGWDAITAWMDHGTAPTEVITPDPVALDDEKLWELYPDGQRQIPHSTPPAPTFNPTPIKEIQEFYVAEQTFLLRVLQRLEFQRFVTSCQPYDAPSDDPNADQQADAAFSDSLSWLERMLCETFPQPADRKSKDHLGWARGTFAILAKQGQGSVDVFENFLNTVPLGIISQKDIGNALDAFNTVEKIYLETTGQLGAVVKDQNDLVDKIKSVGKVLRDVHQDYQDELKKLSDIPAKITEVIAKEEEKKKELQNEANALKKEIQTVVNCDVDHIVEALSTVFMFVEPQNKRALMGGYMSIGLATSQSIHESLHTIATSGGGRVEKQYLLDKIDIYTGTSTEALKDTLRSALDRNEAAKLQQQDYLAQIQVDEERFNSMCDQYLGKMKGVVGMRAKFKAFIRAVQAKHTLISEYNRVFTRLAEIELQTQKEKAIQASLRSQVGVVSDTSLQAVAAFMTVAYHQIGKNTMKLVYSMMRAYNCASFQYSGVIGLLKPLHCFSDVTAQLLDVAVKTRLNQDFRVLFQNWAKRPAVEEEIPVEITKENGTYLELFQKTKRLNFDLTWTEAVKAGFDESWWDVRLESCEVYLHGATAKGNIVRIKISNTGAFRFYDKEGQLHIFEIDTSIRPFAYKYSDEMKTMEPTTEPVQGETFSLSFEANHPAVYLQSPLTGWTVEVGDNVDLSGLTKVELRMKVCYRTK